MRIGRGAGAEDVVCGGSKMDEKRGADLLVGLEGGGEVERSEEEEEALRRLLGATMPSSCRRDPRRRAAMVSMVSSLRSVEGRTRITKKVI